MQSNLFLSPLAGYTNLPFRLVVREIGGVGLCTTDLVNARSLLEKNPKAFKLIETRPPIRRSPSSFSAPCPKKCATPRIMLEALGVASIDINMGCPVSKVCQSRRRLGDDDRTGQNRRARQRHGQRRENSRHRQNAPRLGR